MNFNFIEAPAQPAGTALARLPHDPLGDAPLPALRLLAVFLASRGAEAGCPGPGLSPWIGGSVCRTVPALVDGAQRSPGVRRELDRWLDRALGEAAAPYETLSPFELAAVWADERHQLRGPSLAAFLWILARRNDLPSQRLAGRVAASLESRTLGTPEELLDG